ncbi:MAG TPA: hypothetical protein VNK95_25100 [Caldilineaceae bacterium]|nr:hypothetical protein [Caldilineaceae bacterium]
MIAWTFRGSTLKTWMGLEDERKAFARYRKLRAAERVYLSAYRITTNHLRPES